MDKDMIQEYVKQKDEDLKIIKIADDYAENEGEDRAETVGNLLQDLKGEIALLDEDLEGDGLNDEERADAALKKGRLETVVEKLESLGVTTETEIPLLRSEDHVEEQPDTDDEQEEEEEEEEAEDGDEPEREVEVKERAAHFTAYVNVISSSSPEMIRSLTRVESFDDAVTESGYAGQYELDHDGVQDEDRTFRWFINKGALTDFLSMAMSFRIGGRLVLNTAKQVKEFQALPKPLKDFMRDHGVEDWDGEEVKG